MESYKAMSLKKLFFYLSHTQLYGHGAHGDPGMRRRGL